MEQHVGSTTTPWVRREARLEDLRQFNSLCFFEERHTKPGMALLLTCHMERDMVK